MAETELDPIVMKRTQDTLGKYIKRPQLTEKLLKKPPFRFLHDLFKAVIKETGCFDGLYSADELNFENIKDREDKTRFLQKMIDVVNLTTQRSLDVRPSKIVAGHEAERTNELLQMMGEIIEQQLNWKDAVKLIADGMDKEKGLATKKKDAKGDKTKELAKSKPSKDVRAKESRNSKNATPSLDEKAQKTARASQKNKGKDRGIEKGKGKVKEKEKEKVLSRQATIEKVAAKEKERALKKPKDSNDKTKETRNARDEQKRASPSTQNGPPSVDKAMNGKVRRKSIEMALKNGETKQNLKSTPAMESISMSKQNSTENFTTNAQPQTERRLSKQIDDDEVNNKNPENSIENLTNGDVLHAKRNSADSRKSSANHERNASATKSSSLREKVPPNNVVTQANAEPLKSLKPVNEEIAHAEDTKADAIEPPNIQSPSPSPANAPSQFQSQSNSQSPPKAVRREPTFTHENSRESVGSNSNGSATRPRTSLRPPSARPPSARPGAPRRRDKNVEIILQPNDQTKMSNINVKLESFGDLDDDGENLVIIEDATSVGGMVEEKSHHQLEAAQLEQQGHLVQQILETQKELTQQNSEVCVKADKESNESGFDVNARQSSARQMNNLRDIIQTLTKSVNPFGKLMDFIPEDIDAMQLELNMWRDAYSQAAMDLKREKSLTESATEPMKMQMATIEANIKEFSEMIDVSRVKILQNNEKILKMFLEQ